MAALFRNNNIRMSVITDAFSRLRLVPTTAHLLAFAQMRSPEEATRCPTALGQGQDYNHDNSND